MSALDPATLAAYRAAEYVVFADSGAIVTRIGEVSAALAALLAHEHVDQAALLTACNPRSQLLDAATNALRMGELKDQLRASGWRWREAEGRAADASWCESSVLVLGQDAAAADAVCLRWWQNAWVHYDATGRGALHCTVLPSSHGLA